MILPPDCGVFQSIVHEIGKNLMDGLGISSHPGRGQVFDHQFDILRPRDFAKALHRLLQQVRRRGGFDVETLLARFHPRQGEQVFGEARHAQRALADDLEKLAGVVVVRRAVQQGFGVALDGSQRRAQFVRDIGNEVATGLLHPFGLGKVAQDRHGAAAGHRRGGHIEGASRERWTRPGQ